MSRRTAVLAVAFVLVGVAAMLNGATGAGSQAGTGIITGYVFHDLNRNGIRDEGEPGIDRFVDLVQGGNLIQAVLSGSDGSYRFDGLEAGDYTVLTELDGGSGFCGTPFFSYDPLLTGGCTPPIRLPWHPSTPETVAAMVIEGGIVELGFGGYPADLAVMFGVAILEGDYAAAGTSIVASKDGLECGSTTVLEGYGSFTGLNGGRPYELRILGDDERPGCPNTGDAVNLALGGVAVTDIVPFEPFIDVPNGFKIVHLVGMEEHAWYWFQRSGAGWPPVGARISALVAGTTCGETEVGSIPEVDAAGFSRLVVPAAVLQAGCGHEGAMVSFQVDGVEAETKDQWMPGIQRIELASAAGPTATPQPLPTSQPATTVTPVGPARLPTTGAQPEPDMRQDPVILPDLGIVAAAVSSICTLIRVRRL